MTGYMGALEFLEVIHSGLIGLAPHFQATASEQLLDLLDLATVSATVAAMAALELTVPWKAAVAAVAAVSLEREIRSEARHHFCTDLHSCFYTG